MKKLNRSLLVRLSAVALCAAAGNIFAQGLLTPPGVPAPTMKSLDQIEPRRIITNAAYTISSPGSYYLATNLTGFISGNGVLIQSGNVTLDLNGFTLQGTPGSAKGVYVSGSYSNIIIRNGNINGWGSGGIEAFSASPHNILVEDITAAANVSSGIFIYEGIVRNCVCYSNSVNGIAIVGTGGLVDNCVVEKSTLYGITAGDNGIVQSCRAGNTQVAITAGPNSRIINCTGFGSGTGIVVTPGSLADGCVAYSNSTGFYVDTAATVSACTARSNTTYGIQVEASARVVNCLVQGTTGQGYGIYLASSNAVVDGCQTLNNAVFGIYAPATSTGNLIIRNMAKKNLGLDYSIATNSISGPIISLSSGVTTATGVITGSNPWSNFSY